MILKERMKKNSILQKIYIDIYNTICCLATIISPTLNTKIHYKNAFKKKIDLKNPRTLNEKILWLKLNTYYKNPLVIQCADKFAVRKYVIECGCGDILVPLIGAWDDPDEIPWDDLPDQFVLKWNNGAGMNIVCTNKSLMDKQKAIKQLRKWGKCKYWLLHSEMQYKYIPKKIICEQLLSDENVSGPIPDYKVYCFHGIPQAIFVMHDRGGNLKTEFFDTSWNTLENTNKYDSPSTITPQPVCLNEMVNISKKLSAPFPFVRCDYYIVNNKLYFGELTFTPAGGLYTSKTKINGKDMAEYLNVPC